LEESPLGATAGGHAQWGIHQPANWPTGSSSALLFPMDMSQKQTATAVPLPEKTQKSCPPCCRLALTHSHDTSRFLAICVRRLACLRSETSASEVGEGMGVMEEPFPVPAEFLIMINAHS